MRLTNVAHLRLPFAPLRGYDVSVSAPGRPLPVSFDQRRHVGAGDRPGSWMAISFRLPEPVDREDLARAWLAVVARHQTLRTVFTLDEAGEVALHEVEIGPGGWVEHPIGTGEPVHDALRDVLDAHCTPLSRPAHRMCVLETSTGPTVVIAVDHAHVDMWSMLVVARDMLAALARIRRGEDPDLGPAPSFSDHTRALVERPAAPEDVHRRWAEILAECGDVMPRFPLPLGLPEPQAERVEVRDVLDIDDSAAFTAQARSEGVSTLSLAVSAMTTVTRDLAGTPLRAVFPVHSRYEPMWHESVGWFITNAVIESRDPAPAAAAAAVKEAVRLGSWPLAEVLAPWGGMPEVPGMFAISWLDLRRLPVRLDSRSLEAQYVGATIRTDGVMLWFILDDDGLHLRCRYPDTPEARTGVGAWLDALLDTMRTTARDSAGSTLHAGGREFRVQRARRSDVPEVVALLGDDEIGQNRESEDLALYEAAWDTVARDGAQYLAVVRDDADAIVGTMQLTIIPGLSRAGATRLQIEGVRVRTAERSLGLGTQMLGWAHDHGRAHGAKLSQLTTDVGRDRARSFYTRLGYETHHVGLKRPL